MSAGAAERLLYQADSLEGRAIHLREQASAAEPEFAEQLEAEALEWERVAFSVLLVARCLLEEEE